MGQIGDLIINTIPCRLLKTIQPDLQIWMNINERYVGVIPLLENNPFIDGFQIWEGYDNFPTRKDKEFLGTLTNNDLLLSPMPQHYHSTWYKLWHQGVEACFMNKLGDSIAHLNSPKCYLNKYFDVPDYSNTVALSVFGGGNSPNKSLTVEKINKIAARIHAMGYKTIQLGGFNEPDIQDTPKTLSSYFESVQIMLGCKMLLTVDTGMSWVASGYNHPILGLYGNEYYDGNSWAIQPVNPNAIYLQDKHCNTIENEVIYRGLEQFLR